LTQETFYQAYLSFKTFKGSSKRSTWVVGIARNVYLKHCRRERYISQKEINFNQLRAPDAEEPAKVLDTKESETEIITVLQTLPEQYSSVIIFREIEGLSFEEIGKLLMKSPSTVRVLLFRAKKRFRELYTKKYG